ncbi:PREDICTED: drebrin-like protein [Papilio xuthus]|uniref:Drebrin-like protein n=1 Tax=Papilio xuthus TaxID=66420 RepID=A0A194Q9D0_PAPXU|nr:PREDICTED: drebrin-like protein [Papilio xuthus]KPJ02122.1 Drebrin-like protein [Papilio xuthus]
MAINLEKHREALVAAWKDVLDEKTDTNWALFGYDGLSNDLKFVSKGDGGLTELIDDFNSGKIQYAFLKVDLPDGTISKYVLINWQGEGAPTVRKGTCANHVQHVAQLFTGFHLTMHARTEDDLDEKVILDKLAKAGSAFNFKSSRQEEIPPSGPVGTAYRKVNPVQEINSKERDQFWLKEEQEEKKRIEAEKKRREEEKRKAEEEVRRRDELEAARRAKAEEEKRVPSSGVGAGEGAGEARRLIGASTAAARALFQQNLAQGQMSTRSNSIPEKPVRSSVIAQRINTFSQNTSPQPPTSPIKSPTKTLEEPKTEESESKTSPLKNIDKIKMSLERPSQIQYEPIIDPSVDLSPSTDNENSSFSAINYAEYNETYKDEVLKQSEPMIKQNILENDMFDASYSSSNENDDDDSDNKFSTIKRSPYTKDTEARSELSRQNTVIENVHYKKENGTTTLDDVSPEGLEEEGNIYEDLDDDPGLTARALYDYQAADESEITFDPGDIITHIEQIDAGWWQGLGPRGVFGLFPANYVELLPCHPR